ncbi:hypothetical protein TGRH88_004400 [Toxoplasma gondii]|uniref:Uncharacterized protein n=1 Tax=Toxoplasma gondii TaxID=5811 RepID=A0A7J6KDW5_TOXGO|nr:hypothetical protein TGRH88_004400 [Toxoplasma gondii]
MRHPKTRACSRESALVESCQQPTSEDLASSIETPFASRGYSEQVGQKKGRRRRFFASSRRNCGAQSSLFPFWRGTRRFAVLVHEVLSSHCELEGAQLPLLVGFLSSFSSAASTAVSRVSVNVEQLRDGLPSLRGFRKEGKAGRLFQRTVLAVSERFLSSLTRHVCTQRLKGISSLALQGGTVSELLVRRRASVSRETLRRLAPASSSAHVSRADVVLHSRLQVHTLECSASGHLERLSF